MEDALINFINTNLLRNKSLMMSTIFSVLLGIGLVISGITLSKKGKNWGIYITILGAVSIVANVIQLFILMTR